MLRVAHSEVLSDVGRQRDANEDAAVDASPLFMLADGMGGARAGEVASRTAAEVFETGRDGAGTPEQRLTELAREANRRIFEMAQADESKRGMGTTLTAALVEGDDVTIAHVGDSRGYRLRDGELEQITLDHSLVAELQRSGQISPEDAADHPSKSVITRALGPEPEVEVDAHTHRARPGDVYLLASDGLTDMVSDESIAAILRGTSSLAQAARELVQAANQSGGRDNITVVLFSLEEGDPDAVAAEQQTVEATIHQGLTADDVRHAVAEQERSSPLPPPREPVPASARAPRRRPRRRRVAGALAALLVVAAIMAGGALAARQVYFIGTDDAGLVSIYRGLPYELPLGVKLYSNHYVGSVPAGALGRSRRERVLNHEWRSREDAEDLVRRLEQGTLDLGKAR